MTHRSTVVLAALALAAAAPAAAQGPDSARVAAVADSLGARFTGTGGVPGMSVAVAHRGELVFARGYGLADLETGAPASAETVYRIGSVSKQFTAAMVMRLVEEGRVALDTPLTTYLPDFDTRGETITVRHLLNHTSGIPSIRVREVDEATRQRFRMDLPEEEVIRLFADAPLDFAPGSRYRYSNSGYLLLGAIVSRVTGTPFQRYVDHDFLAPLGLERSRYCDERRIVPGRAEGYEVEDGTLVNAPYLSMRIPGAAGALCSTVGDLARWTHLLHEGRVVSDASLRQMLAPAALTGGRRSGYGFGIDLGRRHGRDLTTHGGAINGFLAMLTHYPEDEVTVAVLVNSGAARDEVTEMQHALVRAALGVGGADLPLSTADVARYEGLYRLEAGGRTMEMRVTGSDGRLFAAAGDGDPARLRWQGEHLFVAENDSANRLVFTVEDGRASRLTLDQEGRESSGPRVP